MVELFKRVTGLELYTRKTDIGGQYNAVAERPEVVERFMFLAEGAYAECAKCDRSERRGRSYEHGPRWW